MSQLIVFIAVVMFVPSSFLPFFLFSKEWMLTLWKTGWYEWNLKSEFLENYIVIDYL